MGIVGLDEKPKDGQGDDAFRSLLSSTNWALLTSRGRLYFLIAHLPRAIFEDL